MPQGVEGYIIDYQLRDFSEAAVTGKNAVKFLYYEDIEGGVDPVYEDQSVRGRSEEHVFYSHTGGEVDSFSLRLPASVDQSDNGSNLETWKQFLFIKSFAYPDYGVNNQGPVLPPRKAIITIGKWYRKVGVIRGLSQTYSKVCDSEGYPHLIDVRFQFRIINHRPLSLHDVRAQRTQGV